MEELLKLDSLKGVSASTIDKLIKAGIITLKSVAVALAKEILERSEICLDTATRA